MTRKQVNQTDDDLFDLIEKLQSKTKEQTSEPQPIDEFSSDDID